MLALIVKTEWVTKYLEVKFLPYLDIIFYLVGVVLCMAKIKVWEGNLPSFILGRKLGTCGMGNFRGLLI